MKTAIINQDSTYYVQFQCNEEEMVELMKLLFMSESKHAKSLRDKLKKSAPQKIAQRWNIRNGQIKEKK